MNILWQNEHYPDAVKGGGGAVNTAYITRSLQGLGHHPVVLARGTGEGKIVQELLDGVPVIRLPASALPESLWPIWPFLEPSYLRPALTEIVRSFDAFVCVDAPYALSIKRIRPDSALIYRTEGTRRGYEAAVPPPSPSGRHSFGEFRRRFFERLLILENDLMERQAWKRCDAIVVKSKFMKDDLLTLYGVPRHKVHLIPNGVDYPRFAQAHPRAQTLDRIGNRDRTKVVITFAGRLVRMKNLPFLFSAFARMRLQERCILLLVGAGDQREALEKEARSFGIASRTRFVGHTEHVEEFLAASDIFVLPSTYEPFGNALAEAMAAGLPCVALEPDFRSIRTASPEIISDEESGYLVDPKDPANLAHKLDLLASDAALRRKMGEQGQAISRARFRWDTCASQYVHLALQVSERLQREGAAR